MNLGLLPSPWHGLFIRVLISREEGTKVSMDEGLLERKLSSLGIACLSHQLYLEVACARNPRVDRNRIQKAMLNGMRGRNQKMIHHVIKHLSSTVDQSVTHPPALAVEG